MEASLQENYHINPVSEERVHLNMLISNQVSIEGIYVSHKSWDLMSWSYFCYLLFYDNFHCGQCNSSETLSTSFPIM